MRYFGGKGNHGTAQRIISMMPPHDVYIETHVGGGAILEKKKPAARSIVIDMDAEVTAQWQRIADAGDIAGLTVINGDAAEWLRRYTFTGRELVYADPPYVMSTRRTGPRYRYEYSDAQHFELLDVLRALPCKVILSGYRCEMYDAALARWHREDYDVWLRSHVTVTESLWCNFQPGAELHDYQHIGGNFRERERIKKKRNRWRAKFAALPEAERMAMIEVLLELTPAATAMVDVEPVRPKRVPVALRLEDGKLPESFPFPRDGSICDGRGRVTTSASSPDPDAESARAEANIHQDARYGALRECPVRQRSCFAMGFDCDHLTDTCPLLDGPNAHQGPSTQLTLLEDSSL
jgi:DNA adenine methylase